MSLFPQSNRKGGRRAVFLTTLVVLFLFALDVLLGGSIRAFVRGIGASVWSVGSQAASAVSGSELLQSRRALLEENNLLKREIAQLTLERAALGALEDENTRLRGLVRLAESTSGVTARVLSSWHSSPYGTFMVGAGSVDGVSIDDLVVAGEGSRGYVIGRVSEVSAHTAFAAHIFAPNASVDVVVGNTPFVAEGRGGGNARADVPRGAAIAVGDVVVAPTLRGMPVGIVGNISQDPASAHQTLYIGLPVNLSSLTFVYVIPFGS